MKHGFFLFRAMIMGILLIVMVLLPKPALHSEDNAQAVSEMNTVADPWGDIKIYLDTYEMNLWVDPVNGNNNNDGLSPSTALRTIQRAADLAGPGMTVHIQPGVYRETIIPAQSGTASATIRYVAENGSGTAVIRGSETSSSLAWIQLTSNTIGLPPGVDPTNIFYADLSNWGLGGPPRFVVELDGQGEVLARLPLAREPDWQVVNEWKYHEYWWAADGGSDMAGCYPPTDLDTLNCDAASRSLTQLTDRHNDTEPSGIEPGNLSTLGNLTGGTLVVMDTYTGTFIFHRTILSHEVVSGRITVDENCGTDEGGLGWGSKYYLEGLPILLDSPGEWWYDSDSGRLFLWPRSTGNPASMNIEISRRENGLNLQDRSDIILDGLTIEFFNRNAIYVSNDSYDKSHNDIIQNTILRYSNNGVWLRQYVDPKAPADMSIDGFTIENSEIAFMDSKAFHIYSTWGTSSSAASFTRSGVLNTVIRHNDMHHLGFRTDDQDGIGAMIMFADHMRFEENHIHQIAHNGVQLMRSVVQSPKKYGFSPSEIKTGEILIQDNIFEEACQNNADCGALKISGTAPDRHVFRDLLITGNIFRDTFGWTYISEKRGHYTGGPSSAVQGLGGYGLYIDMASGVYAYRNIAYNNGYGDFNFYGTWRDGDIIYYNNTTVNSFNGFHFGGVEYDTHGNVNTQVVNNIISSNEAYGIYFSDADGVYSNTTIDFNLYFNNGWRPYNQGGVWRAGNLALRGHGSTSLYPTLQDIQSGTDWENHGVEGEPKFWNYDINDHNLYDGSWPDMHLTKDSTNAIDRGVVNLPDSLTSLLNKFGVVDPHWGDAFDIGRYEAGFAILPNPTTSAVEPGDVAHYILGLYPVDLPFPVTLSVSSPSPTLIVSIEPTSITSEATATLTVTDTHSGPKPMPGLWYSIQIYGDGAGFTNDTITRLLVGGGRLYLPVIMWDINP